MSLTRVAIVSLNQTPMDWPGNMARIKEGIEKGREEKASLVCFPELSLSGYGVEDAFFFPGIEARARKELSALKAFTKDLGVVVGLPLSIEGKLFNAAAFLWDGEIKGFFLKQNLANYGLHYETRWFSAAKPGFRTLIDFEDKKIPAGDISFDIEGVSIGFEICHDAWVENRPLNSFSDAPSLVINPSASHFAFAKYEFVKDLVEKSSKDYGCSYVYSNLVGNEAGRVIYDGASIAASQGETVSEGKRFSFAEVNLTVADLDLKERELKAKNSKDHAVISCAGKLLAIDSRKKTVSKKQSTLTKHEEFTRAVSLGLFDYLRKSRAAGYVVSISGGADSCASTVLVHYAIQLAVKEFGLAEVSSMLCPNRESPASDIKSLIGDLLACVYQATSSSGEVTRNAAREVASEAGASYFEFEIDSIVESYKELGKQALGRELSWDSDDLALQNIQARTRGPSAWLLANLRNSILLATSNRSEAAVGYTTMDGDTCGGLSPIGGIDKAFLREWLRWVEKEGPAELEPVKALSFVNSQEPTAELRPGGSQLDESDLMPYEVLDVIERFAIRDRQTPLEVYQSIIESDYGWDKNKVCAWVDKFFVLWCRNQWKRERYAPSFHLDDENLDPRTWCRFPILSGGFKSELEELRTLAK